MKAGPILIASFLALAGCEAVQDGDAGGTGAPVFSLGSSCLPPEPLSYRDYPTDPAAGGSLRDTSGLEVLFVSADSLHFTVPVHLNCGLEYAFSASLPAPDTLVISERVIGGATAKCMCRKELTVSLRAEPGQSLDKVKVLKAPGGVFADFH